MYLSSGDGSGGAFFFLLSLDAPAHTVIKEKKTVAVLIFIGHSRRAIPALRSRALFLSLRYEPEMFFDFARFSARSRPPACRNLRPAPPGQFQLRPTSLLLAPGPRAELGAAR